MTDTDDFVDDADLLEGFSDPADLGVGPIDPDVTPSNRFYCAGADRKDDNGKKLCTYRAPTRWGMFCPGCGRPYDCKRIKNTEATATKHEMTMAQMDEVEQMQYVSTGIPEVDKVLGGGVVLGKVYLFAGRRGTGKCLGRGTPVMLYDGRVIPVEDVREGDLLMGPDSQPRRVLSTTSSVGALYRIVPNKGASWVCNDVHVLTLVDGSTHKVFDLPLDEYLKHPPRGKRSRWMLFQPEIIHFAARTYSETDYPVSPYFLGIWFGDGAKSRRLFGDGTAALKTIEVSKPDPAIHAACEEEARRFGLRCGVSDEDRCPRYSIVGVRGLANPLLNTLRAFVRDGIRIPDAYLYGSEAVRLDLLAGLLDTDGSLSCGGYEITQKDRGLADQIAFVARSLGLRVTERDKTVNGEVYRRLFISGETAKLPLRIPRKQAPPRKQIKNALHTGFSVEAVGDGDYFGFELDGDGRFLLGDFTVTHNTRLLLKMASVFAKPAQRVFFSSGEDDRKSVIQFGQTMKLPPSEDVIIHGNVQGLIVDQLVERMRGRKIKLWMLDSAQTVALSTSDADFRSQEQIGKVCAFLSSFARQANLAVILIGQINEQGEMAGGSALKHGVDALVRFDPYPLVDEAGEPVKGGENVRILWIDGKTRMGSSNARAYLEMSDEDGSLVSLSPRLQRYVSKLELAR